jgi:hypothetical protein
MAVMSEYLWLVIVGAIGAFGFGWGTGTCCISDFI